MKCKYCVQSLALQIVCEGGILFGPKYRQALFAAYIPMEVQLLKCSYHSTKTALFRGNTLARVGGAPDSCRWDDCNSKSLLFYSPWNDA